MRISRFIAISLFAIALASNSAKANEESLQDNQVKLSVVKYDDHIQFDCTPANADTSSRSDWKDICNKMAAAQASKLAASGTIATLAGPVFDIGSSGDALSRSVSLSQKHL
jgi:hypothetical protein